MNTFDVGRVVSAQEAEGKPVPAAQADGFLLITDTGFFMRGIRERNIQPMKWAIEFGGWESFILSNTDEVEAGLWHSLNWHGRELADERKVEGVVLPSSFILTSSAGIMVLAREYERAGERNWKLYECSGAGFGKIEALMHGKWSIVDSAREALHSALRLAKVTA
jgi:hypothetical protein